MHNIHKVTCPENVNKKSVQQEWDNAAACAGKKEGASGLDKDIQWYDHICDNYEEAEEFITQHGTIVKTPSGYWQQVPQVSIAQTYLKIMNKFCEQFGLTPSARSRIVADTAEDKESDEMELLLIKGGGS